jgi:uncharacterized membrane protein
MNFMNETRRLDAGVNVPAGERIVSGILGAVAAAFGIRHGGPLGWGLAAIGLGLATRGASGRCPVYRQIARRVDEHGESRESPGAARVKSNSGSSKITETHA